MSSYLSVLPSESLLSHFPKGFSPRALQVEALEKIEAAYRAGAQYVVLEAPPGAGKSHIAAATSSWLGNSYVCTLTTLLQHQYEGLFKRQLGARVLKGKSKYPCKRAKATCYEGGILFDGEDSCWSKACGCPYLKAKEEAFNAPMCVSNYHAYVANVRPVRREGGELEVPMRSLLVADEAHGIEAFLLGQVSLEVDLSKHSVPSATLPVKGAPLAEYFTWLRDYDKRLAELELQNPVDVQRLGEYREKLRFTCQRETQEQWVVELPEGKEDAAKGASPKGFSLKPLTVKTYGNRLWKYTERQLLMSATVLRPGVLCESIGLDLSRGDYIELPCPFPKENRPIVAGSLDMTFRNREYSWPKMANMVNQLFDCHPEEKGLLLTPSVGMLEYVRARLSPRNKARLLLANGKTRDVEYAKHLDGKQPTVLGTAGLWEGADLADEASRFQIIPQIPRPHWSGQVKARAETDRDWYAWRGWTRFIQGLGRSVRSETDSAVTYVFDQELLVEAGKANGWLPQWVKEAIVIPGQG